MTNSTFLSIIIPHYGNANADDPLLSTLASITDQEDIKIELILQHGGEVAGLWGKLSRTLNLSAKKEDISLRVIEEPNLSSAEALAAGIKRATGKWIGFLHPGEQYLPKVLTAIQAASEADPKADVFFTGSLSSTNQKIKVTPAIIPTLAYLKSMQPAWPSHSLFCRSTLLKNNFPWEPHYQHQMITEWLLRLLESKGTLKALPLVTTFTSWTAKFMPSMLPQSSGITAFLKPWYQWRHQASLNKAEKKIPLRPPISIYQNSSLTERTDLF